ncbi:MAG: MFS transporter [Candidatus Acidiferrales bacterium]
MKKRYIVLFLLVALSAITFLDRLSIAVSGPLIQDQLHIPPERWGWVLAAFVISCGLFEIPSGAMGDRRGQRRELTRIVAWWSAFMAGTAACFSFWQLVIVRFLFGAGEAGAYPNASGVVSRWFPATERARAQSFIWAASRLGGVITPLLVVPLQARIGWRSVFVLFGALGAVWAGVWWLCFRDTPAEQPGIQQEELDQIAKGAQAKTRSSIPWKRLLASRQLWMISVAYSCYAWGSWFYFSWFPSWMVRSASFSERQMGFFAALPFLCGMAGNVAGGFVSDTLVKNYGLKFGRRVVLSLALIITSGMLLGMSLVTGKAAVVVLACLGFGVMDLMLPAAWSLCLDIGGEFAGTVTGVMNTAGQLGGVLCTVSFGYIIKMTGSYSKPLWLVAFMVFCSALIFARVDASKPLLPDSSASAS